MITDFQLSFPFLISPNLLPNRPLCFPDGSPGRDTFGIATMRFVTGAQASGTDMVFNMVDVGSTFLAAAPLSITFANIPACRTIWVIAVHHVQNDFLV